MNFKVGFATDIGRRRQKNQDNGGSFPDKGLFLVADGMGGHQGGETASAMAVETISTYVSNAMEHPEWDPRDVLARAIHRANHVIHSRAQDAQELKGMGTTTTALLFRDPPPQKADAQDDEEEKDSGTAGTLIIGHVGDSRCYFIRPGALWQLTRDHSLVAEKLRAGLINREQMKTDRFKNVITRSVGFEPDVNVETYEMGVESGDLFLVCSDGLSGMMDDPEILKIVDQSRDRLDDAAKALIEHANENGGEDNITVILVQVN